MVGVDELSWVVNDIAWAVEDFAGRWRGATWGERFEAVGLCALGYAVLFMVACLG